MDVSRIFKLLNFDYIWLSENSELNLWVRVLIFRVLGFCDMDVSLRM
jgi:hypothetical protein